MTKATKDKIKIGKIGGKYIPFHNGHLYTFTKAASQVDKLYIVVCYHERRDRQLCEEAGIEYIDYKRRQQWIMTAMKDMPNVKVIAINDPYSEEDRKSTRLNSSHVAISYAVFCLKKKKTDHR